MKINMSHGSGGKTTTDLITSVFARHFSNQILDLMEDAAVLNIAGTERIAFTTDSFVVTPLFFRGGNIGKLAVCGTVNDLAMMGSTPKYLTCGFILEEGLELADLEQVVATMAQAAREAQVQIVAGDTKVVEGHGGMYINTSGIGLIKHQQQISIKSAQPGDAILVSGSLGNHHACIYSHRMGIESTISSDCAPLNGMVDSLLAAKLKVRTLRDVTRGGLATVLNEATQGAHVSINIYEERIPVDIEVKSFCDILGLDPLYMANEGKLLCIVAPEDAAAALQIMRQSPYGSGAAIIGEVTAEQDELVNVITRLGGQRILDTLYGESLPRIC